jgi:FkbM family methyltransferase
MTFASGPVVRLNQQWPTSKFLDLVSAPESRVHFGQFGEDCIVIELLGFETNGFYIDVGCHDPFRYSNTFLLWKQLGWTGINIDADPRAIERFRRARPNDTNLNVGIGLAAGDTRFTMFEDGAVNTFDPATAAQQQTRFGHPTTITVPVRRLDDVLSEHVPAGTRIGYLNVDCEGLDEAVLRSNDWSLYRPKVISVEIHGLDMRHADRNNIVQFLDSVGYRFRSLVWATGIFEAIR